MTHRRYALYYTCPEGLLADMAAAWLGWDAANREERPHPELGLNAAEITERPRKYGFHATLKAPFRLAVGASAASLSEALIAFAQTQEPVTLEGLRVATLGSFVALVPEMRSDALDDLAASCVTQFDSFRAPLTADELERRKRTRLTASQEALLGRWGYPYVLEEFRFHMTLTGPLPGPEPVAAILRAHFAAALPSPFVIDAVSLCGEREDGRFEVIERVPLKG
ncbi:MAG: DUF1045 domain-containing protein [Pseudomonadota bacterium]